MTMMRENFMRIIVESADSFRKVLSDFLEKLENTPHHQEICKVCNGKGIAEKQPCRYKGYLYNHTCYTCMGTGKVLVFDNEADGTKVP